MFVRAGKPARRPPTVHPMRPAAASSAWTRAGWRSTPRCCWRCWPPWAWSFSSIAVRPTAALAPIAAAGRQRPLRLAVTPAGIRRHGQAARHAGQRLRLYQDQPWTTSWTPSGCGSMTWCFSPAAACPTSGSASGPGAAQRDSAGVFRVLPEIGDQVRKALRRFVDAGGTLYVSDWQFGLVAMAFPEFVDRAKAQPGAVQTVHAEVLDPGLQKLLGKTVDLKFERPAWQPAAFRGQGDHLHPRPLQTESGDEETAALLVQFPFERRATVIFTSFHNETQNSRTELELLRYLVFTAVNAQTGRQRSAGHDPRRLLAGRAESAQRLRQPAGDHRDLRVPRRAVVAVRLGLRGPRGAAAT